MFTPDYCLPIFTRVYLCLQLFPRVCIHMWPNIRKIGLWRYKRKLSYGSTFVAQNFNLLLTQVSFLYVCQLLSYKGKRAEDITA